MVNHKETLQILASLRGAYPNFYRNISKQEAQATVSLWEKMFGDYDYQIVDTAVTVLILNDKKGFPPGIGQVMEKICFITKPKEMTENEAWAIVYKAICNSAYDSVKEFQKLPPEIQSVVHDPEQLRAWAIDPQFNFGVESSNFKRSFRVRAAQLREFNALPSGIKQRVQSLSTDHDSDSLLILTDGDENGE